MYGFIKKIFLYCALGLMCSSHLYAATVRLNPGGGLGAGDGLHTYIEDTTQIQVRRLNNTGQLYNPNAIPSNTQLDNGIYLKANGGLIGPDHFGFPSTLTPTAYINRTVSTPAPAAVSQGVTQSTTSQFSAPRLNTLIAGPSVTVNWKYTYPLDYVTAEVTLVIPIGYPVSSSNPVRYYHAVDTYLGGDDRGCGVRYVDTNGKQIVGTYPLSGGTNAPCPSSSSLPANLDVVESFRERNRSFDHYCVGAWDSFWTSTSGNACAIAKTNSLSDTISTTKIDTGIAIEYDFVLPGTYTFSYDFVVGSTFVPNYDHLEIRHPGTATLCPVDIQVLACLSSTVPCPSNQLVSTGLLTGDLAVSPSTPTVTATPDSTFNLGGNASIDTVTITGSAAATYTLGAGGLTKAPLSGVKCWNTATNSQSCSFTFSNTPCLSTFECMESGLTYTANTRNPIYTKLAGRAFDLDVYALTSTGAKATGYASTPDSVTVELVSDNGGSCGNSIAPLAKKTVSFLSTDVGKKTISFSATDVPNAYPNLRCRVVDTNLNKNGCSSDNFAVRPQVFTVASTNATPLAPAGPTSPTVRRAGIDFNLQAVTGENNYNGTPQIASNSISAHSGAVTVGTLSFTSGGLTTSPANSFPVANAGISTGNTFRYSEVGLFQFMANAVYDDSFTLVDKGNGDCDNASNAYDNNGTGTPKKYGCRVGSAISDFFGRFIPDHFRVAPNLNATLACGAFVYYGQDTAATPGVVTPFTLIAENGATPPTTTQNYTGGYAKFNLTTWGNSGSSNYQFTAAPLNGATFGMSAAVPAVTGAWSNGSANVIARHRLERPANPVGPQSVIISAQPQETDSTLTVTSTQTALTGGVPYRFGRLAITPVHGSELLPLPLRIESQFWNGTTFIRSTGDSCTSIGPTTVVMRNYVGNLNACETRLTGGPLMNNGVVNMALSAPGVSGDGRPNTGSVDLEVNLGAAVAGERTCTNAVEANATNGAIPWFGGLDPTGRASFGIYKAPIIYMRENF